MLARIRAVLRRWREPAAAARSRRFAFDRFVLDLDARRLTDEAGRVISLTSGEFDLLALFLERPRRVLSRDQILDRLRGRGAEPFDRSVDMLVSRLRRKLEDAEAGAALITTVRNNGYLLTVAVRAAP